MNWDDLRVLNAAAETSSLSAAARRLGISQPKASRRLRALEDAVGARLFDRLPSGLAPTPAGERLIPLVAEMATAADAVHCTRSALPAAATGTVRVSAVETIGRFLADRMNELLAATPGIEVEIITTHTEINLSRREADLLIRECLPEGASLISRRIGDLGYAVYGARDLVDRQPAARTEQRYASCDWVGLAEDRLFFPAQKRWLDRRLAGPPRMRTTELHVLMVAIRAGVGLGLAPCCLADGDPDLVRLTPAIPELTGRQHLLIHPDVLREPAVRAVVDGLAGLFRRHGARLAGDAGNSL